MEYLHFHITLFTPLDFLHTTILSLFGYHIVRAIIYEIESLRPEFCSAYGGRPALVPKSAVNNVLRRLDKRLATVASVRGEESCLTLTAEFDEHFLKVYAEGRSSFTGPRMNNLNLVFPYLIRNIVGLRWHKSTVLSSQQLQATHFAVWNWWWVQVRAS